MKYKIGDLVIITNKKYSDYWKKSTGISLYGKLAKIINIKDDDYLFEFKENINGHNGNNVGEIIGRIRHCVWGKVYEFKSINSLKFKKWIKG